MNPVLLMMIGAVSLGFAEAINGHLLKRFKDITSVSLIIIGSIVTFILSGIWLIIFKPPMIELDIRIVSLIIITGLLWYYANKNFYNSFKYQDASTSTIIVMSTIIVTTILGKLIFDESVALVQWCGVVLVAIAVFLINMGGFHIEGFKKVFMPSKATKYVLLAALLYGLGNSASKLVVLDVNPHYYQFLDILLVTPFFLFFDRKEVKHQLQVLKETKAYIYLSPVMLFYFIYNILRYTSLSMNLELPLADAVDNIVVFVIIVLEVLIFNIKHVNILFKMAVALIAVVGVLLITFGS